MVEYSKEELWKIYELLPKELKEAIFSAGTADNIALACQLAGVPEDKESDIAKYTGRVLLGLLPPEELSAALVKELALDENTAKKAAHQIRRLVLNPVKESLALLYEEGGEEDIETLLKLKGVEITKQRAPKQSTDIYREPIEEQG